MARARRLRPFSLAAAAAVTLLLAASSLWAQRDVGVKPTPAAKSVGLYTNSWAVLIGINAYQNERIPPLRYAVNDARAIEQALLQQGFRAERIIRLLDKDATKARIETVLGDDLRQNVGPNDRILVFFAGHGVTDRLRSGEEEGYILPVDGDPSRLYGSAISMTSLRQIADRLPAKHILFVMDACYSGYALFNRSISKDLLDEMVRKPAVQILTAGRQGDQAQEKGGHGVFTEVLIRGLRGGAYPDKGWLALEELGIWIKQRVYAESNRKQVPQFGNLSGEGQFVFLRPDDGAEMVLVPAGEFWMGSTEAEVERAIEECRTSGVTEEANCKIWVRRELPRHRVMLDAFHIDKYEVTNAQFERFVRASEHQTVAEREGTGRVGRTMMSGATWRTPSGPGSTAPANHPVVQMAWPDADEYCRWAGKRLPTEAEWEKAARGTDERVYPWGNELEPSRTNAGNRVKTTVPVGRYPTGVSPYGVHDMAGNVWEWVADWYVRDYYRTGPAQNPPGPPSGTLKIIRGGSYGSVPFRLRTANRGDSSPTNRENVIGFRCARSAP